MPAEDRVAEPKLTKQTALSHEEMVTEHLPCAAPSFNFIQMPACKVMIILPST